MTDLLFRRVSRSRAGADGPEDYDVAGPGGLVVGRIFKASTSPVGTPWMWTVSYGVHEDRTPTHGYARGGNGRVREELAAGDVRPIGDWKQVYDRGTLS